MYRPFHHQPDHANRQGWDAYADTYATLLVPHTVYYLTKEVIHRQIDDLIPSGRPVRVLDLNCGVGNDFPFFLARGWKITGCDGSVGMLNKAYDKYRSHIESGQVSLYHGSLEDLDERSFPGLTFDLVYSVTGGYAYVSDDRMRAVDEVLGQYLAPDGLMVTAHLNSFCASDLIYQLLHARVRPAFRRLRCNIPVQIKGREYRMFLRGKNKISQLKPPNLESLSCWPLLWLTPPYQTGYQPARWTYRMLRAIEMGTRHLSPLALIADQVVTVARRRPPRPGT